MNAGTRVAPVIVAENDAMNADFPLRPFAIRHMLSGHPLLTLPRIAQLAAELPRDRIEYNSGDAAISQDPNTVKSVALDPVEVVRQIETAGAWMVLKRIDLSAPYRELLEDCLMSVARARGFKSLKEADFQEIEGFLFVSSPNSTTPFHLDSEDNFFVQIHGEKFFHIYDNRDGGIATQEDIERSMTKHRNLRYDESFKPRSVAFHMFEGDGCFVPYEWPHWVRTGSQFSISMAITWRSKPVHRAVDLHVVNSVLRGVGLAQGAPGARPAFDTLKVAGYRAFRAVIEPLRSSQALRQLIRRIAFGKNANYYLGK